jgi:hypothetical protein
MTKFHLVKYFFFFCINIYFSKRRLPKSYQAHRGAYVKYGKTYVKYGKTVINVRIECIL